MKKLLAILLVLVVLVSSLISCDILAGLGNGGDTSDNGNGTGTEKRVPVYQGMTIESASGVAYIGRIHDKAYKNNNGNGNDNGNDGNHYGNNKNPGDYDGDYDGKDESVDVENPYPDNDSNENIETEISSSLKVQGPLHDMYYAAPNQDIYIFIHIDNPDSFEIMSFTLNGKKYSSYMFEDGSDMETIILKYNVGDASGIVEYTIDAIKYIDGTEIKDVLIDGDQTVRVGVKTENQVYATVSELNVGTNSISFNANIKDKDNLVEYFKGSLYAVLYDGDEIVAKQELSVGDNSVLFDNLDTNSLYQYAIVGYYDDLSGSGFGMRVLHKNALYTESVVLFDNIVIRQDSISFTLLWHKDHQGKSLTSLTLWKDGNVVSQLNVNATSVDSLLSANSYSLVAEYQNGDETEIIYLDFATFEKGVPGINLIVDSVAQAYVSFSIIEIDEENVGNIALIELVNNNGTVVATSLDAREFTNLLSDNRYTIRVSYVYNLNDGNGDHVITKEASVTTLKKATPTISILNTGVNQDSISFEISEEDTDGVGSITKIELVHKDGTIVADSTDVREFENLLSNNEYTVRVSYVYNLNDGNGDHVITKEASVTTLKKATPAISILNTGVNQDSISFEISEEDTDGVGSITKIELIHKDGTIVADSTDVREFKNLLSNNEYTVRVSYVYDLNDGNGQKSISEEFTFVTLSKAIPSIKIEGGLVTQTGFDFNLSIDDVDNVGAITELAVYRDGNLVKILGTSASNCDGLLSGVTYTLRATYTYDLNDGEGSRTIVKEINLVTTAKSTPWIYIYLVDYTQTSIKFDIEEKDYDNIGEIVKIELVHKNGTIVADSTDVREFKNLLSNNEYTVRVTYAYDLNDGNGSSEIVDELTVKTDKKYAAECWLTNVTITQHSIKAEVGYSDIDNTLVDYYFELYKGSTLVATSDQAYFTGLDYYTDYTIRVVCTVDLNDGNGPRKEALVEYFTTEPYVDATEARVINTSGVSEGDTIFMEIKLDNPSGLKVESVVINGETYKVTTASTTNKIYVEIVCSEKLGGGNTSLVVEKINVKGQNKSYSIESVNKVSGNVLIKGKLKPISMEIVNENFEPVGDYAMYSDTLYVMFTFDNSSGYELKAAYTGDVGNTPYYLNKIDDNHWYYKPQSKNDLIYNLYSVSYIDQGVEEMVYESLSADYLFIVNNIVYVSTPEDLLNMSSNDLYILTNDIDLSGYEWHGSEFKGVLEGNGYSIKNMTYIKTIDYPFGECLGLFSTATGGVIKDLHIENATIIAKETCGYEVYAGFLTGFLQGNLIVRGCSVDENSVLSITASQTRVGGFVGLTYGSIDLEFSDCVNSGSVSGENYVGGFAGFGGGVFNNCVNNGSISGNKYIGGFVGYGGGCTGYSDVFNNCVNNGTVSGNYYMNGILDKTEYVSGFIGNASGNTTFTNCVNTGELNGLCIGGFVGGNTAYCTLINCINIGNFNCINGGSLIGYYGGTASVVNSYSLYEQTTPFIGINGEACTISQLNSKEFYTEILGWSEDVWDLTSLDVENGQYPKLK